LDFSLAHFKTCLNFAAAAAAMGIFPCFPATASDGIETVIVTGSLIARPTQNLPSPSVSIDADDIHKAGKPNLGSILMQLPQVQLRDAAGDLTPTNSNFFTSGFGEQTVDLRQLGVKRTLVLVNGRRWITGSPTGEGVDLNTIPTQLVDHVDIVSGGASSAYGSDAIAGVVNIVFKDDFEGVAATAQYGGTGRGDGGDQYATVTIGGNFASGKGNVAFNLSYERLNAVRSADRDISAADTLQFPGRFEIENAFSTYAPQGRFQYTNDDENAVLETARNGYTEKASGQYGNFMVGQDGFARAPLRYIQVPVLRRLISETGHYDIAPWARFFVEGTYALTSSAQQLEPIAGDSTDGLSAPATSGGRAILIPLANPFYQQAIVDSGFPTPEQACGAAALSSAGLDPSAACTGANAPTALLFGRRFNELGDRTGTVNRDTAHIALGFEGDVGKVGVLGGWIWKVSYVWGRTAESQINPGYYSKVKLQEALDARSPLSGETAPAGGGGFVCNDLAAQAAGCVPVDLFGANSITPEAAAYISALATLQDVATQTVATASASGTLFALPAGDVKLAMGAEYRRETAEFIPDQATQSGTSVANQQPAIAGAFDVRELYGESAVPVLKDIPLARYLELDGAVRLAHYSTARSIASWKYGAIWEIFSGLKLRGSEASATRAPDVGELFTPAIKGTNGIRDDLCRNPTNDTIAQNCATQIGALNAISPPLPGEPSNPNPSDDQKVSVSGSSSGNTGLRPETAHTFTVGAAYTPDWMNGLQATVDYYDIRLHGAIEYLDAQTTEQACYEADPSQFAANMFCQQIVRRQNASNGPIIAEVNSPAFNLGSISTAGVDTALTYAFDLADLDGSLNAAGSLSARLDLTYISHFNTNVGVPGAPDIHSGGDAGQRWRGRFQLTYVKGPFELIPTLIYVGSGYASKEDIPTDLPANHIPSVWYFNLQTDYDLTKNIQLYVGGDNVFDTRPPEIFAGTGFNTPGTNTIAEIYDPIGAFFYGGINVKL
jgi:outer membrane receptor protein involved in Fe transport